MGWGLLHAKNAAANDTCISEDISCSDAEGRGLADVIAVMGMLHVLSRLKK